MLPAPCKIRHSAAHQNQNSTHKFSFFLLLCAVSSSLAVKLPASLLHFALFPEYLYRKDDRVLPGTFRAISLSDFPMMMMMMMMMMIFVVPFTARPLNSFPFLFLSLSLSLSVFGA
jgi:hypothetical protein